ncbi:hypothetical protein [Phycicoccus sp.]|uniref:hypothetical protein n=1 Tax=Phycicoccus sp. TaxID=1902410 RepID=UPI002C5CD7CB|nr:hypothetical protein [Phycicoccus sp.]HMM95532.1 hypothetical protein [Phycicoccus sp.]
MDVEELEALARRVVAAAELVDLRRASLGVAATTWWEGPAAERFRGSVEERRARLAALVDELGWLAEALTALAAAVRAERSQRDADGRGLGRAS